MSVLLLFAVGCSTPPQERAAISSGEAEYVGSSSCATCHAPIARSFARTGMGRSLYPMRGPEAAGYARFGETVSIEGQDLFYSVYEEGGRYFQKQFQRDERGREIHVDVRRIEYVIGSGNHSRSFVTVQNGRHYQMPLCWYPEGELWDLCPGYERSNEHFRRGINETCLFCHNDRTVPTSRFSNRFEEPFRHGIGCERCHGPGSAHVRKWTADDADAYGSVSGDPTIVNPAGLPAERSIQICMQCHLGDSEQTERVLPDRRRMLEYRPGEDLRDFVAVYAYRQKLEGHFGLAAQADRLIQSRCFTASGGRLQCTTCHDPHQEVYDVSASNPRHFDTACRSCHRIEDCGEPHAAAGGGCVGCHMHRAEPHDQRYTTFLDHWIRKRPKEPGVRVRDDFVMEPLFSDEISRRGPARVALHRGRAQLQKKTGTADGEPMPWELVLAPLAQSIDASPGETPRRIFSWARPSCRGDSRIRPRPPSPKRRGSIRRTPTRSRSSAGPSSTSAGSRRPPQRSSAP